MDELYQWNHNSKGNPHDQYIINNSDIAVRPFNFDDNNCYFKLLTVYMPDLNEDKNGYGQFEICFDVYDNSNFGGDVRDSAWKLFLKIGTSRTDFFKENGITVKLIGDNKRCILTCVGVSVEEEERRSYVDEQGAAHHDLGKKQVHKYKYDLYVKLYTDIYCNTYFVKRFISSTTDKYRIYNMTNSCSFDDISLNKTIYYYVSTNDSMIAYKLLGGGNEPKYTKLFELDMSYDKNFYIDYSGIFEAVVNYNYEYKDYPDCKSQYIKFMINARNTDGNNDFALFADVLDSRNYNGNIIYKKSAHKKIEFWYKSIYPADLSLFRKDNDKSSRIFKLDIENEMLDNIDENNMIIIK